MVDHDVGKCGEVPLLAALQQRLEVVLAAERRVQVVQLAGLHGVQAFELVTDGFMCLALPMAWSRLAEVSSASSKVDPENQTAQLCTQAMQCIISG